MEQGNDRQRLSQREKERRHQRYRENCKADLMDEIERRMRTMMIGSIASIESYYDGVIDKDRELWGELRREILDKGNDQIRIVLDELSQYDVEKIGYKTHFKPR